MREDDHTLPEDRPVSAPEAAVVKWLLENASVKGDLTHLIEQVPALRVVGQCGCGCGSVDFVFGGLTGTVHPIADTFGQPVKRIHPTPKVRRCS